MHLSHDAGEFPESRAQRIVSGRARNHLLPGETRAADERGFAGYGAGPQSTGNVEPGPAVGVPRDELRLRQERSDRGRSNSARDRWHSVHAAEVARPLAAEICRSEATSAHECELPFRAERRGSAGGWNEADAPDFRHRAAAL